MCLSSDDCDVGGGQGGIALERGDQLGAASAIAVGVVPELPAVGVVDDAVVGVVRRASRGRPEACVAGGEAAGRPDRGHYGVFHLQLVHTGGEILHAVGVGGAQGVEDERVVPRAAVQLVV